MDDFTKSRRLKKSQQVTPPSGVSVTDITATSAKVNTK